MTDNRTTGLLREGLTERGIEWRSWLEGVTLVGDWCFVEYDNGRLAATCEPVLTPEQAIVATLGSGTLTAEQVRKAIRKYAQDDSCYIFEVYGEMCGPIADELNAELGSEINGDTSDGYHTFNELYHHRAVLFSVIVRDHRELAWKARKHHDGTMYEGMFIVGIETPKGQATYHYDLDPYWEMFDCEEREYAPEWDGHTSDDAIARIAELGSGTCEPNWVLQGKTQTQEFWRCECGNCGECFGVEEKDLLFSGITIDEVDIPNYCPNCGVKVVKR